MTTPTIDNATFVHGHGGVALDDPAEYFHEASRLYPDVAPERLATLRELNRNPELAQTLARSSRVHENRAGIDLPQARLGRALLRDAIARRRSRAPTRARSLRQVHLATVLGAAYRASNERRPVPSGGALYPLELYLTAFDVSDVERGIYHYNPFRHRLEHLGPLDVDQVAHALVDPSAAANAAALVVITAMFWRTRFKYGLRGYRFALLEAGHVAQNVVLAAAALGMPALPLGGFFDTRLDELVGADGIEESSVYALLLGGAL